MAGSSKNKKYLIELSKRDRVLGKLIRRYPAFRLKPNPNYLETLVNSIIAQQLSSRVAEIISERFKSLYNISGRPLWQETVRLLPFPAPEKILLTPDNALREIGLSRAKVSYVKDLSEKIGSGIIDFKHIKTQREEEIIRMLTRVKGIGVWSAKMFLIFSLARINVLPYEDLGIRRAVKTQYGLKKMPGQNDVIRIAEKFKWDPFCTIASLYLWRSIDGE